MNVLDHLPRTAKYREALAMDEELAEFLADDDAGESKAPEISVSEASVEVLLLQQLVALGQAQLQSKQKKRINFPAPFKVRTAISGARERRRMKRRARLEQLVADAQARGNNLIASDPPPDGAQTWTDEPDQPATT